MMNMSNFMRFGFYASRPVQPGTSVPFGSVLGGPTSGAAGIPAYGTGNSQTGGATGIGGVGVGGGGFGGAGLIHPHLLSSGFPPPMNALTLAERLAGMYTSNRFVRV